MAPWLLERVRRDAGVPVVEHGLAVIPVSAFYGGAARNVVPFCFAKRDWTLALSGWPASPA